MRPTYLLKAAATCGVLFFTNNSNAQMVGTDVFLKGRYVEVGMNPNGSYGVGTSPTGYHSHMSTTGTPGGPLGFVADIGMDGWTVGTPAYMGDYFYPGSPFEGWELQVNGKRCQAFNTYGGSGGYAYYGGMPGVTGASVSYAASGTKVMAIWQGSIDSIDIVQTTTVDTNNLYFTVKVVLTNHAVAPKNNIYYFRSVDADNDQTWPGGGFPTNNVIEYQSTDTTIVSATGASSTAAYLAFGTTDTAATALIYTGWPLATTQDLATGYSAISTFGGTSNYAPGPIHFGDNAIGLIINIPHLATVDSAGDSVYRTTAGAAFLHPANQATLNYFYAFSHAAKDSAIKFLDGITTSGSTLAIRNVNTGADIKVYPNPSGEMVNITGLATTDRVLVYDLMGRDMKQHWNVGRDGTNTFRYENLPAGAYVLVVTDAGGDVKARVPVRKM